MHRSENGVDPHQLVAQVSSAGTHEQTGQARKVRARGRREQQRLAVEQDARRTYADELVGVSSRQVADTADQPADHLLQDDALIDLQSAEIEASHGPEHLAAGERLRSTAIGREEELVAGPIHPEGTEVSVDEVEEAGIGRSNDELQLVDRIAMLSDPA
jgi:hypothetical protein